MSKGSESKETQFYWCNLREAQKWISRSLPAKYRVRAAQDKNMLAILSTRGVYYEILNFRYIRGTPKYLMDKEPIEKPKLAGSMVSLWFRPTWKSIVFSLFFWRPDQWVNTATISFIFCSEEVLPLKNIILSSTDMRWEMRTSSVFGWYIIRPASKRDWRR